MLLIATSTPEAPALQTDTLAVTPAAPEAFEAISQFYAYNPEAPLEARSLGVEEFPGFTREKIVFTGFLQSRVPAYLALPDEGTEPFPVVMLLDGITGSKERWFEANSWPHGEAVTSALTGAGFAVIALDARFHGERAAENDYAMPEHWAEIRDMIVGSAIEYRRAMDYLATRPEIDAERIGLLGLSLGGMMTFALSSLEPRVRAAVAGVTPIRTETNQLPIAPQTFAPEIDSPPLLMLMGSDDPLYSEEQAEQLFELVAMPEKDLIFYDAGHRLPAAYPDDALAWFERYLK